MVKATADTKVRSHATSDIFTVQLRDIVVRIINNQLTNQYNYCLA